MSEPPKAPVSSKSTSSRGRAVSSAAPGNELKNMVQPYKKFNLICAILSAFFLFLTVWIWRGEWVEAAREKKMSEVVVVEKKQEIVVPVDKKIERLKDYEVTKQTTTTGNLSILQSSNLSPTTSPIALNARILPTKINLDVPFTSQAPEKNWEQPWQDACEEAAVLMLDAYYKKYNLSPLFAKDEIIKMVEWEQTRNLGKSIEIKEIKEIFSDYFNFKSEIIENPTVEQIKRFIANGNPVLAVADGKVLPNPHYRNGGPVYHALIIRGYDEDEFITNDPGTQFGRGFKYKYDDLMNAIHEWNGGDVKNGRKVILVVE